MVKKLKLRAGVGIFTDTLEYVNVENDNLEIEIITDFGLNTSLFAIIGDKQYKIKNKHFIIEKELLKTGNCNIIIVARVGNKQIGRYNCVPIIIKELDNTYVAIDAVTEYINKFNCLQKEFNLLKNNLEEQMQKNQKLIKSLIIVE